MYKTCLLCTVFSFMSSSCSAQIGNDITPQRYQDYQAQQVVQALQHKNIHIVQLGDSHTAADFMTDAVRSRLQKQLGNGGPGWSMPVYFNGMRLARFSYSQQGWQTFSSRTPQHDQDYPLGGLIAQPSIGATLTIETQQPEKLQTVNVNLKQGINDDDLNIVDADGQHINIRAPQKNNQWQFTQFQARFPITVTASMNFQTMIGGWWIHNQNGQGAVYSALGINGAQLNQWNRWNITAWQQALTNIAPDLIILSYGTNEAYNNIDIEIAQHTLIEKISQIRIASPHSAIMIIGAPESLKNTIGDCGTRPTQLTAFQDMQRNVAVTAHTFYWDWQNAMGGECSMNKWISSGLAQKDGVHFTRAGYQKLGYALADAILDIQK